MTACVLFYIGVAIVMFVVFGSIFKSFKSNKGMSDENSDVIDELLDDLAKSASYDPIDKMSVDNIFHNDDHFHS
jgi:hypothetical protein